ncbi:putative conseved hypothetical protein [Megalodesulfovibrio gigas DSM 1382 = ATCC 19364]|uniref:ORC1/DEAH AAA+ ATPase domain-containing protein n=2 Tax=Megalodesulfovibrio gigas TaxID=879 RepID=T2G795_MEGG1|nr:putative conseved hypothetical protein [Megalodesulfovibrio gigas DSM 1382 = ATCC 19364]
MSYLNLLELKEEPFSNSPDPEFFYESPQHLDCLHRLEISVRLMRGLNVVLGEVGAGKSTLCRLLLRNLNRDANVCSHLLLDPQFASARAMLEVLYTMFLREDPPAGLSEWQLKEAVKTQLFKTAVDDGKLVVLVIDEGQKISHSSLEVLRELLNYETNNTKLLQIVIFAQTEFAEMIRRHPNVADRINEYTVLGPLSFWQTRAMIRHRMAKACVTKHQPERFTMLGYLAVHRLSGGHPRRIVRLCHKAMLGCILRNKKKAGWALVHASNTDVTRLARRSRLGLVGGLVAASLMLTVALVAGVMLISDKAPLNAGAAGEAGENRSTPHTTPTQQEEPRDLLPPAAYDSLAGHGDAIRMPVDFAARPDEDAEFPPAVPSAVPSAVPPVKSLAAAEFIEPIQPAPQPEETAPPVLAELDAATPPPPPALGTYTLAKPVSLEALLQLVYGETGDELRQRVQALNPDLAQDAMLPAGAAVQLPEFSRGDAVGPNAAFVVQITQDESFQMMVDVLQGLKDQGLDVALAAQRLDDSRKLFAILEGHSFQTEQAAAHALRTLPSLFQNGAKVVRDMHRKGEITLASFRKETAAMDVAATPRNAVEGIAPAQ